MPKVSVVTGYYNRAAVLERTIDSILDQTFSDLELVVFDDHSSDGTGERLAQLADERQDPRLRVVVHDTNQGFVRGLRNAIALTTGDYIAIQGSGDVSLPDRIRRQVELLDARQDVGAVGCWYTNVQEGLGTRRLRTPDADAMSFDDLLKENVYSHGEVMIRRTAHDMAGGYRTAFTFAQDRDLWLRIAKNWRLATVPEALYDRYVQLDGVSYVPEKIVRQACFSISAARVAQMEPADENAAVSKIEQEGPTAVVGADDPVVQGKLQKAAVRLVVFGAPESGADLARRFVVNPAIRRSISTFAWIYQRRLFAPFRRVVQRAVGMG